MRVVLSLRGVVLLPCPSCLIVTACEFPYRYVVSYYYLVRVVLSLHRVSFRIVSYYYLVRVVLSLHRVSFNIESYYYLVRVVLLLHCVTFRIISFCCLVSVVSSLHCLSSLAVSLLPCLSESFYLSPLIVALSESYCDPFESYYSDYVVTFWDPPIVIFPISGYLPLFESL